MGFLSEIEARTDNASEDGDTRARSRKLDAFKEKMGQAREKIQMAVFHWRKTRVVFVSEQPGAQRRLVMCWVDR